MSALSFKNDKIHYKLKNKKKALKKKKVKWAK